VTVPVIDNPDRPADADAKQFASINSAAMGFDGIMKESTAKKYLAEKAFSHMTAQRIADRDPLGEVRGWFVRLNQML